MNNRRDAEIAEERRYQDTLGMTKLKKSLRTLRLGGRLPYLLHPVDLRLLQLVGVIHVDGLPLRVKVDRADAAFAVSVAGGLGTAEGQVNFGAAAGSVYVGGARLPSADRPNRLVHVLGVQRPREPV